jgi:formylglycine-generating enzyme required for sulfatase activity
VIKKDNSLQGNPQKYLRALRGGSFINYARNVRSAYRSNNRPDNRNIIFGLRVAMEIKRIKK